MKKGRVVEFICRISAGLTVGAAATVPAQAAVPAGLDRRTTRQGCESLMAFGASRAADVVVRMRHGVCALLAVTAALASMPARATAYETNATVAKIYSMDRVRVGAYDHFTVNGFTSAGSCITNDGLVAIYLRDDEGGKRQLSMVLLARAMGWSLNVRVDDTVKHANGGCLLYVLEVLR